MLREEKSLLAFDHLAVSALTLAEGAAAVWALLGVPLEAGGKHGLMGTHNRLLSLGPDAYLEVIAIDPDAPPPGRARWFDLDDFAGKPRLTNWVARCDGIEAEAARSPPGIGAVHDLERGDLRWRMAIPSDGRLPYGGAYPALIEWKGARHPAKTLPDRGCRLRRLTLLHPKAEALRAAILPHLDMPEIEIVAGPAPALEALIGTPSGEKVLA
jgi:hypothetical protein